MNNTAGQFAAINNAFHDNAAKFASLSLNKADRLTRFNLKSAHVVLEQGAYTANAIAGIKGVNEFTSLHATLSETAVQNAQGYSRGLQQIAAEAQTDFSAFTAAAWAYCAEGWAAWMETATKNPRQ